MYARWQNRRRQEGVLATLSTAQSSVKPCGDVTTNTTSTVSDSGRFHADTRRDSPSEERPAHNHDSCERAAVRWREEAQESEHQRNRNHSGELSTVTNHDGEYCRIRGRAEDLAMDELPAPIFLHILLLCYVSKYNSASWVSLR